MAPFIFISTEEFQVRHFHDSLIFYLLIYLFIYLFICLFYVFNQEMGAMLLTILYLFINGEI